MLACPVWKEVSEGKRDPRPLWSNRETGTLPLLKDDVAETPVVTEKQRELGRVLRFSTT